MDGTPEGFGLEAKTAGVLVAGYSKLQLRLLNLTPALQSAVPP